MKLGERVRGKERTGLHVIMCLLLLATVVAAQCPLAWGIDVPTPKCASPLSITLRTTSWMINGILAVAIAFLAVGIVYMISNALNTPELRAWSINEFWQAVATAFVVLIIFIISGLELQAIDALGYPTTTVPQEGNPANAVISNAHTFLRKVWCYSVGSTATAIIGYSEVTGMLRKYEISPQSYSILGILTLNPKYAVADFISGAFGKIFGYVINPLSAVVGITTLQMFILCTVDAIAMTVLLPFGVVLRSVPFCRGLGTAFIAIAVGFYLVYPLAILLNEKIVLAMTGADEKTEYQVGDSEKWWEAAIPPSAVAYLGAAGVSSLGQMAEATARTFGKHLPESLLSALNTFNLGAFYLSLAGVFDLMFILLERTAFVTVVLGALLPFLAIVITFGVTREIAKLLGSDINLNTLLKVL